MRYITAVLLVLFRPLYTEGFTQFSAFVTTIPLRWFYDATLSGTIIHLGSKSIDYITACSALGAYLFLAVLVLFTPRISFKKGLQIFLTGAVIIFLVNVMRIFVLATLLINNNIDMFVTLHLFTWKVLSGVFVALVWIFLVKLYRIKAIPIVSDWKYLLKLLRR